MELCQRAGKSDADCSYARFLHVPPVPTNVTITAERLEPVIGATQVRVRAAVRLRNAGGTSPPVPSDESLTLSGSMGSVTAPRIASLTASDPDNSGPGYSNSDLLTLRFDVGVFVRYRSWTQVWLG